MDGFNAIHHCNDARNRVDPRARAQVVKPGEDQTSLAHPPDATVISSRDTIDTSIRVERGVEFGADGQTVEEVGECRMDQIVHPENGPPEIRVEDLHEDASDTAGIGAQGMTVENGVGVQPVVKMTTHLNTTEPVQRQGQRKVARKAVDPRRPQQVPKPDYTQEARTTVHAPTQQAQPRQPAAQPEPQQSASFGVEKIRVTLRSDKMGTHRIKVNKLSISDTVIVLGYIDDDDAVIVEPPLSTDKEDTLTIEHGKEKYICLYYGFTSEMQVDGYPMLLVVLVRKDE